MTFAHKYIDEEYADQYEAEYIKRFGRHFAILLWKALQLDVTKAQQIIDISVGHGFPSLLFLRKLNQDSRIIGISEDYIALRYLHLMAGAEDNVRIFGRFMESPLTPMASNYFDTGYMNLAFDAVSNIPLALQELARTVKPGGKIALMAPLMGSLSEVYDLVTQILKSLAEESLLQELMDNRMDAADETWLVEIMRDANLNNVKLYRSAFTIELPAGSYISRDPLMSHFLLPQVMRTLPPKIQKTILHRLSAIRAAQPFTMQVTAACAIGLAPQSADLPLVDRLKRACVT